MSDISHARGKKKKNQLYMISYNDESVTIFNHFITN